MNLSGEDLLFLFLISAVFSAVMIVVCFLKKMVPEGISFFLSLGFFILYILLLRWNFFPSNLYLSGLKAAAFFVPLLYLLFAPSLNFCYALWRKKKEVRKE